MENPLAPLNDPNREVSHFLRSPEQNHALALYTSEEIAAAGEAEDMSSTTSSTLLLRCQEGEVPDELLEKADSAEAEATGMVALPRVLSAAPLRPKAASDEKQQELDPDDLRDEVLNFPTNCPECGSPATTKMKLTSKWLSRLL